jgi:hypothetical protein
MGCHLELSPQADVLPIRLQRRIAMFNQKDDLKAEVMRPIGPPAPGEVTWYRNADGNYTVAAVVVGIASIIVAIYIVH